MILQEDSCKHIRSKAANGDDGMHVPHGVLNGVCTQKGYRRFTIKEVMSENKQQNGARNLKTIAPLCSLCPSRLSTSLNVSRLFKRVPARRKGLDGGHALVGHHWASLTNWTGHIPAMT